MGHFLYQAAEWAAEEGRKEAEIAAFERWCEDNEVNPDDDGSWDLWLREREYDDFREPSEPDYDENLAQNLWERSRGI